MCIFLKGSRSTARSVTINMEANQCGSESFAFWFEFWLKGDIGWDILALWLLMGSVHVYDGILLFRLR